MMARRHQERGASLYDEGHFEAAIAEYRKGYEQKADPVFLLKIGEAYGQLGSHDKELFFYRRYLAASPNAADRGQIEERIAALERTSGAATPARALAVPAPAVAPATPPALDLTSRPPPAAEAQGPLWHRWWFWAGIGVLVAGGIAVGLLVSTSNKTSPPGTDLGTMRYDF